MGQVLLLRGNNLLLMYEVTIFYLVWIYIYATSINEATICRLVRIYMYPPHYKDASLHLLTDEMLRSHFSCLCVAEGRGPFGAMGTTCPIYEICNANEMGCETQNNSNDAAPANKSDFVDS